MIGSPSPSETLSEAVPRANRVFIGEFPSFVCATGDLADWDVSSNSCTFTVFLKFKRPAQELTVFGHFGGLTASLRLNQSI
jgi:hypothetical protein